MNELGAEALAHTLTLEGRQRLRVTGITDVDRFDETGAVLATVRGDLLLRGRELHVEALNLEAGEVRITGEVDSLVYQENRATREGFLARLLK